MLPTLTLFAALLLSTPPAPAQQAPEPDTTRQFRGFANITYAWGTLVLRKGKVVRAYLPTAPIRGLAMALPYYPQPPGPGKMPNPKLVAVPNVRSMRVGSQYWELLSSGKPEEGNLAKRLQTGTVDLFMAQLSPAPILTALGPNPVLSSPADASQPDMSNMPATWYLRRASGPPVVVAPSNFANQVAGFLHDDPDLARRVAAGQKGYRYEELENIIQEYNQRAKR